MSHRSPRDETAARITAFRGKPPSTRRPDDPPRPPIAPSLDHRAALICIEAVLMRMEAQLARIEAELARIQGRLGMHNPGTPNDRTGR